MSSEQCAVVTALQSDVYLDMPLIQSLSGFLMVSLYSVQCTNRKEVKEGQVMIRIIIEVKGGHGG